MTPQRERELIVWFIRRATDLRGESRGVDDCPEIAFLHTLADDIEAGDHEAWDTIVGDLAGVGQKQKTP